MILDFFVLGSLLLRVVPIFFAVGSCVLFVGVYCSLLVVVCLLFVVGWFPCVVVSLVLVVGRWLLVVDCCVVFVVCWLFVGLC